MSTLIEREALSSTRRTASTRLGRCNLSVHSATPFLRCASESSDAGSLRTLRTPAPWICRLTWISAGIAARKDGGRVRVAKEGDQRERELVGEARVDQLHGDDAHDCAEGLAHLVEGVGLEKVLAEHILQQAPSAACSSTKSQMKRSRRG